MARTGTVIAVAAFLLLLPTFATSSTAAGPVNPVNSKTVAGYQVTGSAGSITRIKGSWVVPTLDCSTTPNANLTMSVMLDNSTSEGMRVGTLATCSHGVAQYKVFEVLAPAKGKVVVPTITIHPGDVIEAQGKWSPQTHGWHDQIIDETTGVTATGYARAPSTFTPKLDSGSFIVSSYGSFPLADFGHADFGNAYTGVKQTCIVTAVLAGGTTSRVITLGALATQSGFTLNQITMVDAGSNTMASSGPLGTDGESFSVTWEAAS